LFFLHYALISTFHFKLLYLAAITIIYIYIQLLTNSMEQSSWEAESHLASQEILSFMDLEGTLLHSEQPTTW